MSKELRPYQQQAIKSIKDQLSKNNQRQLLVMSMGLGKTFTAVKAEEELQSKKTIWITDDERLLEQSAMAFIGDKFDKSFYDYVDKVGFLNYCKGGGVFAATGYKMSVIKADQFDTSGNVVFASAQTLWRRLDKLDPRLFDLQIIDEAHCFGAKRLYEGVDFFDVRLRLGLSGTPFRKDGMLMGDMFDVIPFEYGMYEGMRDGWLCELDAIRVKTNISLDKVHTSMGDFNQSELSNEINTPARNFLIADSYLQYAKGKQAIGFGVDIKHCMDLAEAFQLKGINAIAVSSDEERTGDKDAKIKAFKKGQIDVLFNVNLLNKGFDHPDTGCAIAAAPTKSLVRYLQGPAGRISRLKSQEYVSKFGQKAILIDIVDASNRHNLVNAWELDRQKPVEERVFTTREKKDLLLAERAKKAKLEHTRDQDERVKLLAIPQLKLSKSIRMQEAATEAQLKWIESLGYDITNESYTKEMCSKIIMDLPATEKQINFIKFKGYDIGSHAVITRGMVEAAILDSKKREEAAEREKRNKNIQNNLPFKF